MHLSELFKANLKPPLANWIASHPNIPSLLLRRPEIFSKLSIQRIDGLFWIGRWSKDQFT